MSHTIWSPEDNDFDSVDSENLQARPDLDFEIAPDSGVFPATQNKYQTTLLHVNCNDDSEPARQPASQNGFGISSSTCSCSVPVEILPGYGYESNTQQYHQLIQVCPGGCNGGDEYDFDFDIGNGACLISDEAIHMALFKKAQALCDLEHPQNSFLEVVSTGIRWSARSPIPVYFSPSEGKLVPHSSAVTSGHLALIQARGHVDNIEMSFRTYYPQQAPQYMSNRNEPQHVSNRNEPQHVSNRNEPQYVSYNSEPQHMNNSNEPQYVSYNSEPQYASYNSEPQYASYNSEPQYASYSTGPQYASYNSEPQYASYSTGPQYLRNNKKSQYMRKNKPQYVSKTKNESLRRWERLFHILGKRKW
ncbi:hypothetical protein NUW58_g1873 [Xylaria curta]|uniref:Uncharacterized protein n=1 Tax=Xylaria curta TaxID=42375 RepID=A0ACC1PI69_9PEZI|nr:hypothetical protein NUW58_g1873 [Xylaria curta]